MKASLCVWLQRSVAVGLISTLAASANAALTGALTGVTPDTIDLTAEGTLDWAIWGVGPEGATTQLEASSRKDSGDGTAVGLIPDPTDLNGLAVGDPLYVCGECASFQNMTSFSWTDGVPTASESDTSGGLLFRRQGEGSGFSMSFPATETTHRLTFYVSTYRSTARFSAMLSDNSGGYFDTSLTQTTGFIDEMGVYTLEYSSLVADTTLDINYTVFEDLGTFENVGLIAVTLEALDPPSLEGDYTGDGVVDAADYTLWRDTLGQMGEDLPADGDGDLEIGQGDYDLWAANYGDALPQAVSVPEPAALGLLLLAAMAAPSASRR